MNDTTFQGDGKVAYVPVAVNTKLTKQTNADKLRAMTDEELAKWLSCPGRKKDMFPDLEPYIAPSAEEWLNWLKQEADNGQHDS